MPLLKDTAYFPAAFKMSFSSYYTQLSSPALYPFSFCLTFNASAMLNCRQLSKYSDSFLLILVPSTLNAIYQSFFTWITLYNHTDLTIDNLFFKYLSIVPQDRIKCLSWVLTPAPTMSISLQLYHTLTFPKKLSCWIGTGSFSLCHFFPTQRSNPSLLCLLHWQAGSLALHHQGSPWMW